MLSESQEQTTEKCLRSVQVGTPNESIYTLQCSTFDFQGNSFYCEISMQRLTDDVFKKLHRQRVILAIFTELKTCLVIVTHWVQLRPFSCRHTLLILNN